MDIYFFFFNDTATTEIYTLSLHDALPISERKLPVQPQSLFRTSSVSKVITCAAVCQLIDNGKLDRKSTRLNSSHQIISYAVFCLKKKKKVNSRVNTNDTTHWR